MNAITHQPAPDREPGKIIAGTRSRPPKKNLTAYYIPEDKETPICVCFYGNQYGGDSRRLTEEQTEQAIEELQDALRGLRQTSDKRARRAAREAV